MYAKTCTDSQTQEGIRTMDERRKTEVRGQNRHVREKSAMYRQKTK